MPRPYCVAEPHRCSLLHRQYLVYQLVFAFLYSPICTQRYYCSLRVAHSSISYLHDIHTGDVSDHELCNVARFLNLFPERCCITIPNRVPHWWFTWWFVLGEILCQTVELRMEGVLALVRVYIYNYRHEGGRNVHGKIRSTFSTYHTQQWLFVITPSRDLLKIINQSSNSI